MLTVNSQLTWVLSGSVDHHTLWSLYDWRSLWIITQNTTFDTTHAWILFLAHVHFYKQGKTSISIGSGDFVQACQKQKTSTPPVNPPTQVQTLQVNEPKRQCYKYLKFVSHKHIWSLYHYCEKTPQPYTKWNNNFIGWADHLNQHWLTKAHDKILKNSHTKDWSLCHTNTKDVTLYWPCRFRFLPSSVIWPSSRGNKLTPSRPLTT